MSDQGWPPWSVKDFAYICSPWPCLDFRHFVVMQGANFYDSTYEGNHSKPLKGASTPSTELIVSLPLTLSTENMPISGPHSFFLPLFLCSGPNLYCSEWTVPSPHAGLLIMVLRPYCYASSHLYGFLLMVQKNGKVIWLSVTNSLLYFKDVWVFGISAMVAMIVLGLTATTATIAARSLQNSIQTSATINSQCYYKFW